MNLRLYKMLFPICIISMSITAAVIGDIALFLVAGVVGFTLQGLCWEEMKEVVALSREDPHWNPNDILQPPVQ